MQVLHVHSSSLQEYTFILVTPIFVEEVRLKIFNNEHVVDFYNNAGSFSREATNLEAACFVGGAF